MKTISSVKPLKKNITLIFNKSDIELINYSFGLENMEEYKDKRRLSPHQKNLLVLIPLFKKLKQYEEIEFSYFDCYTIIYMVADARNKLNKYNRNNVSDDDARKAGKYIDSNYIKIKEWLQYWIYKTNPSMKPKD